MERVPTSKLLASPSMTLNAWCDRYAKICGFLEILRENHKQRQVPGAKKLFRPLSEKLGGSESAGQSGLEEAPFWSGPSSHEGEGDGLSAAAFIGRMFD